MKKLISSALLIGVLAFNSCSSSDDSKDESSSDCRTCDLEFAGQSITSEYCDNGDGTITVTTLGESETESLEGISFAQYMELVGTLSTCN